MSHILSLSLSLSLSLPGQKYKTTFKNEEKDIVYNL